MGGVLLVEARNINVVALYPWLMLPVVPVILVVLAFNFLGDGLRRRGRSVYARIRGAPSSIRVLGRQITQPGSTLERLQRRDRVLQPVAADRTYRHQAGNRLAVPGDGDVLAALDLLEQARQARLGL